MKFGIRSLLVLTAVAAVLLAVVKIFLTVPRSLETSLWFLLVAVMMFVIMSGLLGAALLLLSAASAVTAIINPNDIGLELDPGQSRRFAILGLWALLPTAIVLALVFLVVFCAYPDY